MIITVKFYTLSCPLTNEVRYVGKTVRTLSKRLISHISDAKLHKGKSYRNRWISKLLQQGLRPIIELIYESEENENSWQEKEKFLIYTYKRNGCKLVNTTDGGDGYQGSGIVGKRSEETIKRMSEAALGRKWSEDMKELLRQSSLKIRRKQQINNYLCKTVLKCNLNEEIIEEYFSLHEAARINNCSAQTILNRINKKYKDNNKNHIIWKYK